MVSCASSGSSDAQTLVKSFEVTDLPVRAAKFVPRKSWIVTGSVSPLGCSYIYMQRMSICLYAAMICTPKDNYV